MKIRNIRTVSFMVILCLALSFISGCGKNQKLEDYRSSMEEYYKEASSYNDAIDSIDPDADDAGDQLLKQLDGLNEATQKMAALDVPSQFASNEELADDAADYMNQAVTLYHQAYSSDPYDPDLADQGRQYYERANKRIMYILKILHGEAPDETGTASVQETETSAVQETSDAGSEDTAGTVSEDQ